MIHKIKINYYICLIFINFKKNKKRQKEYKFNDRYKNEKYEKNIWE